MLRILLIEDSDSDAYIIQKAIHDHVKDAVCSRVANAKAGEEYLQKRRADIILLDLGLPDSSNPADTYTRICRHAGKIPIVISTNIHDHALAMTLVHEGAEDYLNKDLIVDKPEHVRDAITFAIERHALLQKAMSEKEEAVKESEQKDTVLNCFMGGYSVSNRKK
ncbi:MAG: response regulator [Proteobacteria bacterium]|nr:response regulator [Pseudomonadota bacterium]